MEELHNCGWNCAYCTEAVGALKPKTVNTCWKPLWSEVVDDLRGFPTIDVEIRNILNVAREVGEGGGGFFDMS